MELTRQRFDYGDLSESEQRHLERQADKLSEICRVVTRSAIETGEILAEVHSRLSIKGHGTFDRWVEERCGITPRHARNFMAAFDRFGVHKGNISLMTDTAMFALSSPSVPDSAVQEALRLSGKGMRITVALAKKIVEHHKPATETAGYSAHGLPGIGKGGKGSARQRNLDGKLAKLNKQQEQQDEEGPAESEPAGQPADEPGDVGVTADAGPSSEDDGEPIDASSTVIETTGRVVEVGNDKTTETPAPRVTESELRDALTPLWRSALRLGDSPVKAAVVKCLADAVEMLMTGVPLDDDEPAPVSALAVPAEIVELEPTGNEITGEPSVMTFAITPAKRGGCAEWELSQSYLEELQEVFAGVDVLNECRKARLWCSNNTPKRKTAKGMREFLRRWMEKQQNSGGGAGRGMAQRPDRLSGVDEYLAEYGEHAA